MISQNEIASSHLFWQNPKMSQLFEAQLKESSFQIARVTTAYIELKCVMEIQHSVDSSIIQLAHFTLIITKAYPASAPSLFLSEPIHGISLNDSRELLLEVLEVQWTIKTTLKMISVQIPQFIHKIESLKGNLERLQKIGIFVHNKWLPYKILKSFKGAEYFSAFYTFKQEEEVDQNVKLYLLSITQTHFLILLPLEQPTFLEHKLVIPKENQITSCKIIFCAELQSLEAVSFDRARKNQLQLTFSHFLIKSQHFEKRRWKKELKVVKSQYFISYLIKSLRKFKQLEEISIQYANIDQEEKDILEKMRVAEKLILHAFNRENVERLHKAYQTLIQYYSSVALPFYEVYLFKVAQLYSRKDVQIILSVVQSE